MTLFILTSLKMQQKNEEMTNSSLDKLGKNLREKGMPPSKRIMKKKGGKKERNKKEETKRKKQKERKEKQEEKGIGGKSQK